jgi:hypothetical protein
VRIKEIEHSTAQLERMSFFFLSSLFAKQMMLLACLYWLLRFVGESSFPSTRKGFIFDQQMTKKKRVYLINDSSCC